MSLFDLRPGIDDSTDNLDDGSLPSEARLHELCSALAAEYTRLIKEQVITKIEPNYRLSIRDFQVLSTVYNSNEALTSSHIYKKTGLDPATVTRSVKVLSGHGLLVVEENEVDSRSRLLKRTDKGEELSRTYSGACSDLFVPKADSSAFKVDKNELNAVMSALVVLRQRVHILRQMRGPHRR